MISFLTQFWHEPTHCAEVSPSGGSAIGQDETSVAVVRRLPDPLDSPDLGLMDDSALLAHIHHCGIQMLAAHKLGMKQEARRWLSMQEAALREKHRRPDLVARLEAEKGLS